jgi:hypothetical protein
MTNANADELAEAMRAALQAGECVGCQYCDADVELICDGNVILTAVYHDDDCPFYQHRK